MISMMFRVVLLTHSLISIGSHGVITIIGVMAGRTLGASQGPERSAEGVDGPWITGGVNWMGAP